MGGVGKAFRVLRTLWAGSLWSLAIWVAPTMFHAQSDRHVAGLLVTRLFSIETYLAVAVGVIALLLPGRTRFLKGYLAAALLATNEWMIKRFMTDAHARGTAFGLSFGAWHGVSMVIYILACLAVLLLVWNEDSR